MNIWWRHYRRSYCKSKGLIIHVGSDWLPFQQIRVKMGVKMGWKLLVKGKAVRCTLKYLIGRIEEQEFGDWKIRAAVCSREIISLKNPRVRIHQNQKCFDHDIKRFNPKKIKSKHSNKVFRGKSDFDRTNYFLDSLRQIKSPLEKFFGWFWRHGALFFKSKYRLT